MTLWSTCNSVPAPSMRPAAWMRSQRLRKELGGRHAEVVKSALAVLRGRFGADDKTEGYRKDGPVAVARFESDEGDASSGRESRILRQREVSDLVDRLLFRINRPA